MRALLMALFLTGCGGGVRHYDASLFKLASGFSAQEVCSCVFVMERDEAYCGAWSKVSPDVAKFTVDQDKKEVRARALGMGKQVSRFVDEQQGCVLVDE